MWNGPTPANLMKLAGFQEYVELKWNFWVTELTVACLRWEKTSLTVIGVNAYKHYNFKAGWEHESN